MVGAGGGGGERERGERVRDGGAGVFAGERWIYECRGGVDADGGGGDADLSEAVFGVVVERSHGFGDREWVEQHGGIGGAAFSGLLWGCAAGCLSGDGGRAVERGGELQYGAGVVEHFD